VIVNQVLDELGISLDHELADITPGLDKPHVMQSGSVRAYLYQYFSTSISLPVFLYQYLSTSIYLLVFLYSYLSASISLLVFLH